MKSFYVHLNPTNFLFFKELKPSHYTYTDIPEFAFISSQQTKKFLKDTPIFLTNKDIHENFESEINTFFKLCKTGFPSFYNDPFWLTTLLRLYIILLYCKKNNIKEFIHLEYDNLIYSDLNFLKVLPPSVYFTRVGPFCSSAGFMYCNDLAKFEQFFEKIKNLLEKGETHVLKFTQYGHLSEMILIDLIYTHTQNIVSYLPILPFAPGNDNFDKLQVLFDGASYGQYLGGTNNENNKGWYGLHHYVGQEIHKKTIDIVFEDKPFVLFNNQKIPIINLHIHSKKLDEFCIL